MLKNNKERSGQTQFIMINRIIELGHIFLDYPERELKLTEIKNYEDDLSAEIDRLFLSLERIEKLKSKYVKLRKTRDDLSKYSFFNDSYISVAKNWLENILSFQIEYFEFEGNKDEIVSKKILEQIVQSDCSYDSKSNKLIVGVGHPIVLMSLIIAYYQRSDLYVERERLKNETLNILDSELYYNKFDRLFRDLIILYDKEFYRIVDAEYEIQDNEINNLRFIAEKENNLTSIEPISATRLFEKIELGLDDPQKKYKVLLVGDFIERKNEFNTYESTVDDLAQMLVDFGYKNVELYHCDKMRTQVYVCKQKKEISLGVIFENIFTPNGINICIKNFDKVFLMDCPSLYRAITLCEMEDALSILHRASGGLNKCIEISTDTARREFSHKNSGFASIFYRVQNCLLDISKPNLRKTRKINDKLFEYIQKSVTETNKKSNSNKEVFVYISNNADFENELYDKFNITRNERYNSKDCKIIKFGDNGRLPDPQLQERELRITLYKLLKMISPSPEFHEYFTCSNHQTTFSDYAKKSRSVDISIKYSPVIYSKDKLAPKVNLDIIINSKQDSDIYKKTECLMREMFDFDDNSKANIIKYCYKKAVANVFSGNVRNFNDCLFYHFYNRKLLGQYNYSEKFPIEFCIKSVKGNNEVALSIFDNETYNYSFKRLAYSLMDILDVNYYNEDNMYEHIYQAMLNKDNIDDYVDGLLNACQNMNYINSNLVYRLIKYYR